MTFLKNDNIINYGSSLISISIVAITTISCGFYKPQKQDEIIVVPRIPEEFKNIPIPREKVEFIPLPDKNKVRKSFSVGRSDPFMPPLYSTKKMSIPESFR